MPKKTTEKKTSSKLSSKDIITIMKQAKKLNVSSISIEGLSVTFYDCSAVEVKKPQVSGYVSTKIPDAAESAVVEESEEELREFMDALADQTDDLMNPGGYEKAIFSRQKAQEKPQTEVIDA